jgi:hypothetical protein
MKLAPTLVALERAEWNFLDTAGGRVLAGGKYAKAETEAWRAASAELRALLRVARAAGGEGWGAAHHQNRAKECSLCRALIRLEKVSRGRGENEGEREP